MIFSRFHRCMFTLAVSGGVLLWSASSQAANFTYHVDLNVASLVPSATTGGMYSLDFQLNGDGLPAAATNSITVSNFAFTPLTLGGPSGAATSSGAGATGDLSSQVHLTLTSSSPFNELYQNFTATTTDIQFNVTTTGNGSGITPDLFTVQIYDVNGNQVTTGAPDGSNALVEQPINGTVTLANVSAYNSTTPAGVTVTVTAAPEPSTWAAVLLGLGVIARTVSRRRPARA